MSIPRLAIHRPVTVFMLCSVVLLLGTVALLRLPVDLMPDLEMPSLTIRVTYEGVGPREIEESITRPIERSVAAVAGLDQINSESSEGSSQVRLNFTWGTDIEVAADDVRARLDRLREQLPEDAEQPTLYKFDASQFPIVFIAVAGDFDPVTLRELTENDLMPRFERIAGVAAVDVRGGLARQILVELSREKTTALGLPVDQIVQLLQAENQNVPVGEIDEGDLTYLLRSPGQFTSLDDIRDIAVMTRGGGASTTPQTGASDFGVPVYLRDVAEVRDGTEDRRSFVTLDGKPGIRLMITKQSGENTVGVAERIRAEVERINRDMPSLSLRVTRDMSVFINQSIAAVREAVLLGSVLVVLIIFIFLRSFRSTLIICTSIPISIIGTFALLYFGGYTLNTMTFGGLALGVGMIVDASIVVLENTQRHMEMGKDRVQAAIEGSEEIWSAIIASTLTHIAVFVPLFFLAGFSSILFKQLSIVVIFSLMMSLFVAVTLVPVLCATLLKVPAKGEARTGWSGRVFEASERWFGRLDDGYRGFLHRALAHRPTVLAVGTGLFVLALVILPLLHFELMPQTDEGEVEVDIELPVGTRIERTEEVMKRLEQMARKAVPETTSIFTEGGGGGWRGGSTHTGEMNIQLTRKEERTRSNEEIAQALRRELAGLPGVEVRARASGGNFTLGRILGDQADSRLSL
ncbi:MAG: efflux RND transporter permease subunit, partial [Vicinamibacteraceae bacterium]